MFLICLDFPHGYWELLSNLSNWLNLPSLTSLFTSVSFSAPPLPFFFFFLPLPGESDGCGGACCSVLVDWLTTIGSSSTGRLSYPSSATKKQDTEILQHAALKIQTVLAWPVIAYRLITANTLTFASELWQNNARALRFWCIKHTNPKGECTG